MECVERNPGWALLAPIILNHILRTVRIGRVTPIRDFNFTIHDAVAGAYAFVLANSTEIEVGIAVGVRGYPDAFTIQVRHGTAPMAL